MNPAERNYSIMDKEALAVVRSLQHWRHWLEGTQIPIDILTDHRNLEYFTKPRILNRRQLRWMDLLKQYNYQITYRPGSQNTAADALSRRPELAPEDPPEEKPITMIPPEQMISALTSLLEGVIHSDEQIRALIAQEPMNNLPPRVEVIDGLPFYNKRVYVLTKSLRTAVLRLYHDSLPSGHLGIAGTLDLVKRAYWWKHMATDVTNFVKSCNPCAQNKHPNSKPPGALNVLPIPHGPWEWTQSDHITGLPKSGPYDAIYAIMD